MLHNTETLPLSFHVAHIREENIGKENMGLVGSGHPFARCELDFR